MNIVVVSPSDEFELYGFKGGNQRIAESVVTGINEYTHHTAVQAILPLKFFPMRSLFRSYLINYSMDYSGYDMVISTKFPSWALKHPNHICYFIHAFRQVYDWWPEWHVQYSGIYALTVRLCRIIIKTLDRHFLGKTKKLFTISQYLARRIEDEIGLKGEALFAPSFISEFKTGTYSYVFSPSILSDERKRISLIIKAIKLIERNDIKLIIAGDGPSRKELEAMAESDERIEFLGYQDETRLSDLYADALCVPFVSYIEDHGLVTIEAFKSRKPVITCTDSGGPLDFVEDGINGFVCDPDPRHIASRIEALADNRDRARQMGEKGFEKVKGITWENTVKRLTEIS